MGASELLSGAILHSSYAKSSQHGVGFLLGLGHAWEFLKGLDKI